jgi:hypothetical protein
MTTPPASLRSGLAALYPPVLPPSGRSRLLGPPVFLLGTAVALLRLPLHDLDTLWAEDGALFLRQALEHGTAETVSRPYAGYLHAYPRAVTELVTRLPLGWAGLVFSIAGAAVMGLGAWSVWTLGAGLLPSPWLRGCLAGAVVLLPAGALEAADNVANSHFPLMFAAFWALLARRPGAGRQVVPTLIVVLAALSDPLSGILLPLAIGRLLVVSGLRDRVVPAAYVLALTLQLGVALGTERNTGSPAPAPAILYAYLLRVVTTNVIGLRGAARLVASGGPRLVVALAAVVLLVVVAGMVLPGRRLAVAAAALASMAFYVAACLFALGGYPPPPEDLIDGSRYTIVPGLLLLSALALAVQSTGERLPRRFRPAVAGAAVVPLLIFLALDFRTDIRGDTPSWSRQVEQAARSCHDGQDAVLTIAPEGGWQVPVSCAVLRDG